MYASSGTKLHSSQTQQYTSFSSLQISCQNESGCKASYESLGWICNVLAGAADQECLDSAKDVVQLDTSDSDDAGDAIQASYCCPSERVKKPYLYSVACQTSLLQMSNEEQSQLIPPSRHAGNKFCIISRQKWRQASTLLICSQDDLQPNKNSDSSWIMFVPHIGWGLEP